MEVLMILARVSVALVVAACMAATVSAIAAKRTIVLEIALPTSGSPQIKVIEGETATVTLPDGRKFGFVPAVSQEAADVVRIEMFDLLSTPHKEIGTTDVAVGGDPVQSETDPKFGLRVLRVTSEQ